MGYNRRPLPLLTHEDKVRFRLLVDKKGPLPPVCPELGRCWIWNGLSGGKYGLFRVGHGHSSRTGWGAHRISKMIADGWDNPELDLHHLCKNKFCVNPLHLQPLSQHEHNQVESSGYLEREVFMLPISLLQLKEMHEYAVIHGSAATIRRFQISHGAVVFLRRLTFLGSNS